MNSVGSLPLSFLKNTNDYKARAAFANAKSIMAQYKIKAEIKKNSEILFQDFKPLKNMSLMINDIEDDISYKEFDKASQKSARLIELLIDGLRYFQTYDWLLLRTIISLGYLSWIAYSTLFIIKTYYLGDQKGPQAELRESFYISINVGFWLSLTSLYTLLYQKDSPLTYYFYGFFPLYYTTAALKEWPIIPGILTNLKFNGQNFITLGQISFYLVSLEILVASYFQREILTVCLLAMGLLWPLTMPKAFAERHFRILRAWRVACLITSVFTLLPVELEEEVSLM
jgi:phosphatidylinositol glycan class N